MIPEAYDLKRRVARHWQRFWCGEDLRGLIAAPVYHFADQERFDSDEVEMAGRRISAGPLRLPHRHVIFEVTDRGQDRRALVAYAWETDAGVEAVLLTRLRACRRWTDVLARAQFRADGWAEVEGNPRGEPLTDEDPYVQCLTGMVWRALAILAEAGTTIEKTVSKLHRPKLAGAGIRGWTWHQVEIVPERLVRTYEPAGRHPRQPALACPTRPLAAARGRAAGVRARLRGGRSRTRRSAQGLHHRRPRGMTDFTPSPAQAAAIREIKDWFENRTAEQQVFRMFGYAGSGKSTVLRFALDELGLSPHQGERDGGCVPGVVTATFTGKAAYVLRSKGTPARTIHSLIYSVLEATEEEVEAAAKKVREAETGIRTPDGLRAHRRRGRHRGDAPGARADEEAALRAQPAERRGGREAHRARRGLDGRRGDGARPDELRQADPGARRSRPAAADQGRRRLHPRRPRRHADRDPPPGGGERDHPPRHHGAAGRADRLRRVRPLRRQDAQGRRDAGAGAALAAS